MLAHLECLVIAANELGLKYDFVDKNNDFVRVLSDKKVLNFIKNTTSFNTEDVSKICLDKSFTTQILSGSLNMPKTIDYIDPLIDQEYRSYAKFQTLEQVAKDIETNFNFPIIIKPNSKTRGTHVYKAHNYNQILTAVKNIFNHNQTNYDYLLLAQECINIKQEYRVVVFNQSIVLNYLKDNSKAIFNDNLSPLHWDNSKAVEITDQDFNQKMQAFINPIFEAVNIVFAGLDVVIDNSGKWWLIEINTFPGFKKFLENNPKSRLIQMYKEILTPISTPKHL
jgi:glutathione synthase/RimK-type ligase-like ATP-grasp enzyme